MRELLELARTERVEEHNSRWLALLPLGVGQFQNGNDGLGYLLLLSQSALLAASITTYALHEDLNRQVPVSDADRQDARFAERAYRYTNQVSVGVLALVTFAGILDAQIRFRDSRVTERTRRLPPHLEGPPNVAFTGSGVRIKF